MAVWRGRQRVQRVRRRGKRLPVTERQERVRAGSRFDQQPALVAIEGPWAEIEARGEQAVRHRERLEHAGADLEPGQGVVEEAEAKVVWAFGRNTIDFEAALEREGGARGDGLCTRVVWFSIGATGRKR